MAILRMPSFGCSGKSIRQQTRPSFPHGIAASFLAFPRRSSADRSANADRTPSLESVRSTRSRPLPRIRWQVHQSRDGRRNRLAAFRPSSRGIAPPGLLTRLPEGSRVALGFLFTHGHQIWLSFIFRFSCASKTPNQTRMARLRLPSFGCSPQDGDIPRCLEIFASASAFSATIPSRLVRIRIQMPISIEGFHPRLHRATCLPVRFQELER